jgi:hypothetical protein
MGRASHTTKIRFYRHVARSRAVHVAPTGASYFVSAACSTDIMPRWGRGRSLPTFVLQTCRRWGLLLRGCSMCYRHYAPPGPGSFLTDIPATDMTPGAGFSQIRSSTTSSKGLLLRWCSMFYRHYAPPEQ